MKMLSADAKKPAEAGFKVASSGWLEIAMGGSTLRHEK